MTSNDWEYIFNNIDRYSVPIYDDGYLDELLFIMFNENSDVRKEWLSFGGNYHIKGDSKSWLIVK